MERLEHIVDELTPATVVELAVDDGGESSASRLAPQALAVVRLRPGDGSPSDVRTIAAAVARIGEPIDLVVDHWLADTERVRAVFEALFPLVRFDGLYVIEGAPPLDLVLELMLSSLDLDVIHEVMSGADWLAVRRSVAATPDSGTLQLAALGPLDFVASADPPC